MIDRVLIAIASKARRAMPSCIGSGGGAQPPPFFFGLQSAGFPARCSGCPSAERGSPQWKRFSGARRRGAAATEATAAAAGPLMPDSSRKAARLLRDRPSASALTCSASYVDQASVMVTRRGERNAVCTSDPWGTGSDPVGEAMAAGALRPRALRSSGDVLRDAEDMLQ